MSHSDISKLYFCADFLKHLEGQLSNEQRIFNSDVDRIILLEDMIEELDYHIREILNC